MISNAELANVRNSLTQSLTDTATIQTRTVTNDGAGNAVETYAGTATVKCRIRYDSGGKPSFPKLRSGDQSQPQQLWVVTLPYDASVNETDRLIIKGTTYEVVTANEERSLEICQRVKCKRV